MTIFNFWLRINICFVCLFFAHSSVAEQSIGSSLGLSIDQRHAYEQKNIKILGAFQLDSHTATGKKLMEFSGLAWDEDENLLYALSDRGYVIHLRPTFKDTVLTDINFIADYPLKNKQGKNLVHKHADSEGLALLNSNNGKKNDTELIVSFERIPRIIHYTVTGDFISKEPINNVLNDIQNYSSPNKSLEAITVQPQYKFITGPERPLVNSKKNQLALYTLDKEKWSFTPYNENYGSLVGLTTLPDGSLIALERIFPGILAGVTNVIHEIKLNDKSLSQKKLVLIQPSDGYFNENFEGITWHKDNRFFMINDDNDSLLQRTVLVYFEIPSLNNDRQ